MRLLRALAEPGAAASPDPTDNGALVVRIGRGGVTLGRGTHPEAAAQDLLSRDLLERTGPADRPDFAITPAGIAFLKRQAGSAEDRFARQHREAVPDVVDLDGTPESVVRNAAESPLAWLRRRKDADGAPLIDAAAFEAGERLRRDLTLGGMLPSVTARWDGAIGGGGGPVRDPAGATDTAIAARQRVTLALDAVGGDFADLLVDLCGFLKGVETLERERRWPPRSAKVVIRLALRRLAEHYGLGTEARGPDRSRGLRSWTADPGATDPSG